LDESPKANNTNTPTIQNTTSPDSSVTMMLAFNYKAEFECPSVKIETTLRKHFDDIFAQMEAKIDNLVKQHEEQVQVNINVVKQLSFLVDNMKCFLKYACPQTTPTTPSPQGEGQS